MDTEGVKGWILILCALTVAVALSFSAYFSSDYYVDKVTGESDLSIYTSCNQEEDGAYRALLSITNYAFEDSNEDSDVHRNIRCRVTESAGLTPDADEKTIESLTPGSEDFCLFKLTGTPQDSKIVRFSVSYDDRDQPITQYCELNPYFYIDYTNYSA